MGNKMSVCLLAIEAYLNEKGFKVRNKKAQVSDCTLIQFSLFT